MGIHNIGPGDISDPERTKTPPEKRVYRLLIMGSPNGHHSLEFYEYCLQFDIILLFLPPLSAPETQPTDVGVFRHLKDAELEAVFERADQRASAAPKPSTSRANATISNPVSASSAVDRPEIPELARLDTLSPPTLEEG